MKEGNPGMNAVANVIGAYMAKIADKPLVIDFGIINGDYSLTTNHFPMPIPKEHYSVCRSVTYSPKVALTETYVDGSHDHPGAGPPGLHSHQVKLPEKMYWIRPGDRVLVAWVENEAVVIDIVFNASTIGSKEPNYY